MTFVVKQNMFALLLLWILLFSIIQTIAARPGNLGEYGAFPTDEDRCKINDQTVIETCQRCAKQTKSPIVYPMCCSNEDDAYAWCNRYTTYGRQEAK